MKGKLKIFSFFLFLLSSCGRKQVETKPIIKDVTETVFASGMLEAEQTYSLIAQSDGYLSVVDFKENDLVKKGQVLAVIDNRQNQLNANNANQLYQFAAVNTTEGSPLLIQAKNGVNTALNKLLNDSLQSVRYNELLATNSVAKKDAENAALQFQTSKADYTNSLAKYKEQKQDAEKQLLINRTQKDVDRVLTNFNNVTALSEGKIYQKLKNKGDYIKKGDVLAIIGDAAQMYAKVNVDEGSIAKIEIGQQAEVRLNTDKSKSYTGFISEKVPLFNEETQSFMCRIRFREPFAFTTINHTQLEANIVTGVDRGALLIPRSYLNYGNMVRVKGQQTPVKIETKVISTDWVEVKSGISAGTVIISNQIK